MSPAPMVVVPPSELIRYTCGFEDADEYVRSGREVATQLELAARRHFGPIGCAFSSVLDFGCGAGRLLGALDFGAAAVSGCDVGARVASFSAAAYPSFDIRHIDLYPPLPYDDGQFDLVYSFSVFSHLTREVEALWLAELARVGAAKAAYLITIQGDWMIEEALCIEDQVAANRDGFLFRLVHGRNHDHLDFPDYYESSFHTSAYVREHWSTWFEIVDIVKGESPRRYLIGDQKFRSAGGDVPDFRPMGQDLVIARKR